MTFDSEKELADLLRAARNSGLVLVGPFRRRNGSFVFSFGDTVITESELKELYKSGKLSLAGIRELIEQRSEVRRNHK